MTEGGGAVIADMIARGWNNFIERQQGSLSLRFLIQPLIAGVIALRAGIKDAREGRPAYLWGRVREPRLPFAASPRWLERHAHAIPGFCDPGFNLSADHPRFHLSAGTALYRDAAGSRAVPRLPRPSKSRRSAIYQRFGQA